MSDLDSNQDILLIRKHLVEHLGPPDEVFEVSGSPLPGSPVQALNLAYFAPAGPHSPVVFATCGASQFTMKDGRRVEGILILRREPDGDAFEAVHRMLASFALFAEANDQVVRHGDVVRAPDELSKFCDMDALLFMPPIPFVPTFHKASVTDGEVEILWLLPVFDAEAEYALTHGPQSLMMLFAAQGLDLTDARRPEANTMMEPGDAAEMAKRMGEENARKVAEGGGPRPVAPPAKPKTSRRDIGKGSYDVEEQAGEVKISRRSKVKKAPELPKIEPAPGDLRQVNPQPMQQRRKSVTVPIPKMKEETRFNLGAKKPESSTPKLPPRPVKKLEPVEDPEVVKQRRVAELKKKAREAAERAKARQEGKKKESEKPGLAEPSADPTSAQRAAAQRRGAPKRAIEDQLDDED